MVGPTLRDARTRKGLSLEDLAKTTGISRKHIAEVEKGANASIEIVLKIARALEVKTLPIDDTVLVVRKSEPIPVSAAAVSDGVASAREALRKLDGVLSDMAGILSSHGEEKNTSVPLTIKHEGRTLRVVELDMDEEGEVGTTGKASAETKPRLVTPDFEEDWSDREAIVKRALGDRFVPKSEWIPKDFDYPQPYHGWEGDIVDGVVAAGAPTDSDGVARPRLLNTQLKEIRDAGLLVIRVAGDSMLPKLKHGDLIVFNPKIQPKSGQIVAVHIGGEGSTVGIFHVVNNEIILVKLNPKFPPIIVREDHGDKIQGVVIKRLEEILD